MEQPKSKLWKSLLLLLIPLWISLACITIIGGTSPEVQDQSETTVKVDVTFGPGPFIFPDPEAGLADLASYKTTLIRSFDGTRDGRPFQSSTTYIMLTTKEPEARLLTVEKSGDLTDLEPEFMAEADGAAYERLGGNACTANVFDAENSFVEWMSPVESLHTVIGADEAGSETVNDVTVNHYTFDERAFGQLGFAKLTGEMWVASEGGYIVKYLVTTQGDAKTFGEGFEGALTLDYELTEVNQLPAIELPADCPAGMVDAPLLPDAANVLNMPSVLKYDTSSSLTDAAAFYQEQIPGLGWALIGEPTIAETSVFLKYEQGDQTLSVIVTTEEGMTAVNILLSNSQE